MTTGTKCCIHYKDGLPYCVECEKKSDQRREELHAKLAEAEQSGETLESKLAGAEIALEQARADADHWKGECNALQRMVHEARAEIEHKNKIIEQMREVLKAIDAIGDEKGNASGIEALRCFSIARAALAAEGGGMS